CQFLCSLPKLEIYSCITLGRSTSGSTVKEINVTSIPSSANASCKRSNSTVICGQTVSHDVKIKLAIQIEPYKSSEPNGFASSFVKVNGAIFSFTASPDVQAVTINNNPINTITYIFFIIIHRHSHSINRTELLQLFLFLDHS